MSRECYLFFKNRLQLLNVGICRPQNSKMVGTVDMMAIFSAFGPKRRWK